MEESTDDELVPGLCEKVVDVFVDHSSQCPGGRTHIGDGSSVW